MAKKNVANMWQYHTIMPQSKEVDNQKVEKICGNMANNCVMYVKKPSRKPAGSLPKI